MSNDKRGTKDEGRRMQMRQKTQNCLKHFCIERQKIFAFINSVEREHKSKK